MKKDIHPNNYRLVVFKDLSNEDTFITKSTVPSKETITWEDGKEYPLVKMEISNTSHPFFTGKMNFVDTAGRIEKFNKKFAKLALQAKRKKNQQNKLLSSMIQKPGCNCARAFCIWEYS